MSDSKSFQNIILSFLVAALTFPAPLSHADAQSPRYAVDARTVTYFPVLAVQGPVKISARDAQGHKMGYDAVNATASDKGYIHRRITQTPVGIPCDGNCIIVSDQYGQTSAPQGPEIEKAPAAGKLLGESISLWDPTRRLPPEELRFPTGSTLDRIEKMAPSLMMSGLNIYENAMAYENDAREAGRVAAQLDAQLKASESADNSVGSNLNEQTADIKAVTQSFVSRSFAYFGSAASLISSQDPNAAQKMAKLALAEKVAADPLSYRYYQNNALASQNIQTAIRKNLKEENWREAARLYESVAYDSNHNPIDRDIRDKFNSSGIFLPEKLIPSLGPSPLSGFHPQTANPKDRQLVVRLANKYQSLWAESGGQSQFSIEDRVQFVTGLAALRIADQTLNFHRRQGVGYLRLSQAIYDGITGFIDGAKENLHQTARLLPDLARASYDYLRALEHNPAYLLTSVKQLYFALPKIRHAIALAMLKDWHTIIAGSARKRGELAGQIAVNIGVGLATEGVTSALSAAAEGGEAVEQVSTAAAELKSSIGDSSGYAERMLSLSQADTDQLVGDIKAMPPDYRESLLKEIASGHDAAAESSLALADQLSQSPNPQLRAQADQLAEKSLENKDDLGTVTQKINRYHTITNIYDADVANEVLKTEYGYDEPPFLPETKVVEFISKRDSIYARVQLFEEQPGGWIVRRGAIEGLSAEEIAKKLSLKYIPQYISDVEVPAGSRIVRGIVNKIFRGESGGGVQFFLEDKLPASAFRNTRGL